jgi:hypothetical protein
MEEPKKKSRRLRDAVVLVLVLVSIVLIVWNTAGNLMK